MMPGMDYDVDFVLDTLEAHKAIDVQLFPTSSHGFLPEKIIVASGTSSRHVATLAEQVAKAMKKRGFASCMDGIQQANWVVLDTPSVCVHIFRPEVRAYYDIESLYTSSS